MRTVRLLGLGLGLFLSSEAMANDHPWTGATDNDWGTTTNWNTNVVPGLAPNNTVNDIVVLDTNFGGPTNIGVPANAAGFNLGGARVNSPGFTITNNNTTGLLHFFGPGITGSSTLSIVNPANGLLDFSGSANAGMTTITNSAAGGVGVFFRENSQAGSATIVNNGDLRLGGRTSPLRVGALSGTGDVRIDTAAANPANDEIIVGGSGTASTFTGTLTDGAAPLAVTYEDTAGGSWVQGAGATFDNTGGLAMQAGYMEWQAGSTANFGVGGVTQNGGDLVWNTGVTMTYDDTVVSGGTMQMDANYTGAGNQFVDVGGTVIGTGAWINTFTNNGTVIPGNSADLFGTLTVANYNPVGTSTGVLVTNITPTTGATLATTNANLTGTTLVVNAEPGRYTTGTTLNIVTGVVANEFGSVTSSVRLAGNVAGGALTTTEIPFAEVFNIFFEGGTGNEQSLAGAFDIAAGDSTLAARNPDFNNVIGFINVLNRQQFRNAMRAVSSIHYTAMPRASFQNMNLISSMVHNSGVVGRDLPGCVSCPPCPPAPCPPAPCPPKACAFVEEQSVSSSVFARRPTYRHAFAQRRGDKNSGFTRTALGLQDNYGSASREMARNVAAHHPGQGQVWFQGFAGKTAVDNDLKDIGFDAVTTGAMMGLDYGFDDRTRVGVGGGYAKTRIDYDNQLGESDVKGPFVSVWGSKSFENFELDVGVTLQYTRYDTIRNIVFQGVNRQATSTYNGRVFMPHVGAAYNIDSCGYHLKPFAAFDMFVNHEFSFLEKGANSLNLIGYSRDSAQLQSSLGLAIDKHVCLDCGTFRPELAFSYRNRSHLWDDGVPSAFANQRQRFVAKRTAEMQHRMGLNVELGYAWHEGGSVKVGYRGDYGRDEKAHMAYISAGKSW